MEINSGKDKNFTEIEQKVLEIFNYCKLVDNTEIIVDSNNHNKTIPTVNYVYVDVDFGNGEGIYFSTQRLNERKAELINLIDSISPEFRLCDDIYAKIIGEKKFTNMKIFEKLLVLGTACQAFEKYTYKRDRENDSCPIIGKDPDKDFIDYKIIKCIEMLNFGLSQFGIKACLNPDDREVLDFYDNDNRFIIRYPFIAPSGVGALRRKGSASDYYLCDNLGQSLKITYETESAEIIKYCFVFSALEGSYKSEISVEYQNEEITGLTLCFDNGEGQKYFSEIGGNAIHASYTKKDYDTFGNCVEQKDRNIRFVNESGTSEYSHIEMSEYYSWDVSELKKTKCNSLAVSDTKITLEQYETCREDRNETFSLASKESNYNYSHLIASHPRNTELIEFVFNQFDILFPGIQDFIAKKFPIYNSILDFYPGQVPINKSHVDNFISKLIIVDCYLPEKDNTLKKSLTITTG